MRRVFYLILVFLVIPVPAPLSAARGANEGKVLFLGDSFSIGAFGRTFDSRMRENGLNVFTVVAGGASPYYWLDAYQSLPCAIGYWEKNPREERRLGYIKAVPKIENLIDDISPDIVVVQTGVNLYATLRSKRRPKEKNVAEVRRLIDQMCYAIAEGGAKGYWILPPHSHESRYPKALQQELADLMKDVVKEYNGAVFESQKYTRFTDPYPSTDGIHYGPTEAQAWAERVAYDFNVYLRINHSYASRIPIRATPVPVPVAQVGSSSSAPSATSSESLPAGMSRSRESQTSPQSAVAAISGQSLLAASSTGAPGSATVETPGAESKPIDPELLIQQAPEVDLTLRLIEKSTLQNLSDVPYKHALGVFEYEVVGDRKGNYPLKKIRVAHGIVFNRKFTSIARSEVGSEITLRLVPLSKYRSLQTWQTVDDLRPNFELPLYTPKLD